MVMTAKKAKRTKKASPTKQRSVGRVYWLKHHPLILIAIVMTGVILSFTAYNKYLDWQNLNDLKAMLADFEQLERDVETATGEELYIEASCGTVEKFNITNVCYISLATKDTLSSIDSYSPDLTLPERLLSPQCAFS